MGAKAKPSTLLTTPRCSSSCRALCPVPFSPHDIRHLFITEFLITLRLDCGAGTEHMDTERYQREREAFGSTIMGWRSSKTIDVYDHSRDGEHTLQVLARMQQSFAEDDMSASLPLRQSNRAMLKRLPRGRARKCFHQRWGKPSGSMMLKPSPGSRRCSSTASTWNKGEPGDGNPRSRF